MSSGIRCKFCAKVIPTGMAYLRCSGGAAEVYCSEECGHADEAREALKPRTPIEVKITKHSCSTCLDDGYIKDVPRISAHYCPDCWRGDEFRAKFETPDGTFVPPGPYEMRERGYKW